MKGHRVQRRGVPRLGVEDNGRTGVDVLRVSLGADSESKALLRWVSAELPCCPGFSKGGLRVG